MNTVLLGDCLSVLPSLPDNSVDLIITSPPYAERRKHAYGGVPVAEYVKWFLPRSAEFLRTLSPVGSFILNIKEHVEKGERSTYVMELVIALCRQGWLWTEEYIWHKKNAYPGKWPNRFRDSWEHLYHFTKQRKFSMYQDEMKVEAKPSTKKRLNNLNTQNDIIRLESATQSKMGKNFNNFSKDTAYPTNVLFLAPEASNQSHSAAFPISLPSWFIRLFTKEGDIILDPFCGSGTTLVAAKRLNRQYIGIDIMPEYVELSRKRLSA